MQRLIVVTVLILLCIATGAHAEPIEALWQLRADETLDVGVQRATKHALREAVYKKALELLPSKLKQEREELLHDFLGRHAARLARVEGAPSLSERVDGMVLRVDVVVDEAALRSLLQRCGVYFTAGIVLPYSLSVAQAPEGSSETLSRLEKLTGVTRQEGAVPSMRLTHEGVLWKGVMEGGKGAYEAAGSDLETLWVTLWGWYFMVHGPDSGPAGATTTATGTVQLVVQGFASPDAVYDFERVLQGFRPAIAGAKLTAVNMQAEGVGAIWKIELLDEGLLRQRLDAYAPSRGLGYQLVGAPAAPQQQNMEQTPQQGQPAQNMAPESAAQGDQLVIPAATKSEPEQASPTKPSPQAQPDNQAPSPETQPSTQGGGQQQ